MKINYVVGHYWDPPNSGQVSAYMYFSEVHYGTLKDAEEFLEYVQKQSPDHNWKIFQLVQVPK